MQGRKAKTEKRAGVGNRRRERRRREERDAPTVKQAEQAGLFTSPRESVFLPSTCRKLQSAERLATEDERASE